MSAYYNSAYYGDTDPQDQQPDESSKHYEAYLIWRDMSPPRTALGAYRIYSVKYLGKTEEEVKAFKSAGAKMSAWRRKYRWDERVADFDRKRKIAIYDNRDQNGINEFLEKVRAVGTKLEDCSRIAIENSRIGLTICREQLTVLMATSQESADEGRIMLKSDAIAMSTYLQNNKIAIESLSAAKIIWEDATNVGAVIDRFEESDK